MQILEGAALLTVVTTSFLGSVHCLGMCGGLALQAKTKSEMTKYHLGRLITYTVLGALGGGLGSLIFSSEWLQRFSLIGAAIMGLLFVSMGIQSLRGRVVHFGILPNRVLSRLFSHVSKMGSHLALGLGTGFLPCGWLYSFVLLAVATHSAFLGAFLMVAFWAGSVPALASSGWVLHQVFRPWQGKFPKIAGISLIVFGIFTFAHRLDLGASIRANYDKKSATAVGGTGETVQAQPSHSCH